mmetsp:Transcript_101152/g.179583  ORF Transcript_101152/g.179583 Transcript_101152/m.179583 type:complete len:241 (+) Transcript_101152:429-1151(+)
MHEDILYLPERNPFTTRGVSYVNNVRLLLANVAIEEDVLDLGLSNAAAVVDEEQLPSRGRAIFLFPIRKVVHNGSRVRTSQDLMRKASIDLVVWREGILCRPEGCIRLCRWHLCCRSSFLGLATRRNCLSRRVLISPVLEQQTATHAITATNGCVSESHVPRGLVAIHRRRLLRLVLTIVSRMLQLAEKLEFTLDLAQLLFTERAEDHRESPAALCELDKHVPEGREDLMSTKAHDVLRL